MDDTAGARCDGPQQVPEGEAWDEARLRLSGERRPWDDIVWLPCSDGKARPTQSGIFPLAHGIPGRVGRLRAYGNAIVPQVAAEFIKATGSGD
jgi:DNA (cytosine-5)-methyltransferase 1